MRFIVRKDLSPLRKLSLLSSSKITKNSAGRYSSVDSDVAWESRGTAIDPRVRHIFSWRFGHDLVISTAILPLPLIQEEHLSVNGERMGAKYW